MNPNDADTPEADAPIAAAPADEAQLPATATERPKRPRAPRKKAVAAEATDVADASADAGNVVDAVMPAAPADATSAHHQAEPAGEPAIISNAQSQAEPSTINDAALGDAPAPAAAVADDGLSEGQRRGRNRRRGRRSAERAEAESRAAQQPEGQAAGAAEAGEEGGAEDGSDDGEGAARERIEVPRPPPAEVGEVFAEVLSGAYDSEPVTDEAPAAPGRRVLAAEPDAPKLHKVLAQAGVGSRRDLEQMILDGRVTVNGEAAHVGQRISFGDRITVAGKPIKYRIAPPPARVLAYHKPAGEVVTHDDPQQRPTVFRRLPRLPQGKWQSVGRLDINTEGLLLFTNSGELANQLMHPRFGVEREYAVRSLGVLEPEAKARLLEGVPIDGQSAAFKSIEDGGGEGVNHWYRVVITEGRNREVRKLFEAVGHAVSRLIRIRYGSVVLPRGLKRGGWVDLHDDDVRVLRQRSAIPQAERPQREDGDRGPQADAGQAGAERLGRGRRGGRGGRDPVAGDRPPRTERPPRPPRGEGFERPERAERSDMGPIPNPLQQTFDKRAIQQVRAQRREPSEDGPIPNPLQQTYDKRALMSDRAPRRELSEDGPIPNPLQQTYDKRFTQQPRGFGPGGSSPHGGGGGGGGGGGRGARRGDGPQQSDPSQSGGGYIGGDAFLRKGGKGGGRGGRGGGGQGGGQGGQGGGGQGGPGRGRPGR